MNGGTVHIGNWQELADVGEFNPAYLEADAAPKTLKRLLASLEKVRCPPSPAMLTIATRS